MIITEQRVNVRSEPSLSSKILGVVNEGENLTWYDTVYDADSVGWYEVQYDGKYGYICGKYSRLAV